jgi:hypothetical protein
LISAAFTSSTDFTNKQRDNSIRECHFYEKLIIVKKMLSNLYENLKISQGRLEAKMILEIIRGFIRPRT